MGPVYSVAFAPDGRTLAAGTGFMQLHSSPAGEVKLWELPGGTLRRTLTEFAAPVEALAYAPDGKLFATASRQREPDGNTGGVTTLRDGATGAVRRVLTAHHPGVFSLAFSRDGQTLSTGGNGEAKLWSVATGKEAKTLTSGVPAPDHYLIFHSVALSPDGRTLVAGTASIPLPGRFGGDVRLWDAPSGKPTRILTGHTDLVTSVAFSPDGKLVASGSYDRTLKLWDVRNGVLRHTLTGHTEGVNALAFSPDGRHLASAGQDGTIRLWSVGDGALLVTLQPVYLEGGKASREWLASTRTGYFECSPGARPYLRWQVGDRRLPLERYEPMYHRPDELRRALQ
jgi:WD40 repeat protein